MNTKTDGISSGLVAAAWMTDCEIQYFSAKDSRQGEIRQHPLVRISDAEAIIAAKDVEIRQWRVLAHQEHGYVLAENRKQAERIKELEYVLAPIKESSEIAEKAGRTALEWVEYAKQLESDLGGAVGAENSRLRSKVAKQSAALKLAKGAFSAINIEAKTFMSYENARNNFSDDTDERKAYERAMVKASELTKQALAAIDALEDNNG